MILSLVEGKLFSTLSWVFHSYRKVNIKLNRFHEKTIWETETYQQMLAAEQARLAKASATPFPRMFPLAERLVTALENSKMMNATVDRIV